MTKRYNPISSVKTLEDRQNQAIRHCEHLIKDFSSRADRHKNRYQRLQNVSIFLTALTTVLSAISASNVLGQLNWIILSISGLATFSTALFSQSSSQRMWIESRNISQKLQAELFLYVQSSGLYSSSNSLEDAVSLFSDRLMEIWNQAQEKWAYQASTKK